MSERFSFEGPLQKAWDSTSLTTLMECPRKYQYSLIQGFAPRKESVHLTFGIHFHFGLELYDHFRAVGGGHDETVHAVVKQMLVKTAGWTSDDPYKNRFTLIRSLVWYMDEWPTETDPAKTIRLANGKPAVELSFRFEVPDLPGYLYCGHMDKVATFDNKVWVVDRKSTKSTIAYNFFDKFRPNNQMTGYTVGGKICLSEPVYGVIIDAVQVAVGFTRFQRGFTLRSDAELDEWFTTLRHYIRAAENYASDSWWPMNYSACDNYGGCPFRPICAKPPTQRQIWLESEYAHRLWDPLAIRGDI